MNFMIVFEPENGFSDREETVFPLGLVLADGKRTVTSFQSFKPLAVWLDSLPEETLFTPQTRASLLEKAKPLLSETGYTGEVFSSTVYRMTDRTQIHRSCLLSSTELLLPEHRYRNLTECEPDPLGEGYLCFGTVEKKKILSAASENPHPEDSPVIDIGVETAPGYTGRGFASSNVAALAYFLLDPGVTVTYIVEDGNPASARVAEKVGFMPGSRELRLVCTLAEESGEK